MCFFYFYSVPSTTWGDSARPLDLDLAAVLWLWQRSWLSHCSAPNVHKSARTMLDAAGARWISQPILVKPPSSSPHQFTAPASLARRWHLPAPFQNSRVSDMQVCSFILSSPHCKHSECETKWKERNPEHCKNSKIKALNLRKNTRFLGIIKSEVLDLR